MRLESRILIASEPMLIGSYRDGGDEMRLRRACPFPRCGSAGRRSPVAARKARSAIDP